MLQDCFRHPEMQLPEIAIELQWQCGSQQPRLGPKASRSSKSKPRCGGGIYVAEMWDKERHAALQWSDGEGRGFVLCLQETGAEVCPKNVRGGSKPTATRKGAA